MPWTRKQVKYLLSKASPLKPKQRKKMLQELHDDPSLGHAKKRASLIGLDSMKGTP